MIKIHLIISPSNQSKSRVPIREKITTMTAISSILSIFTLALLATGTAAAQDFRKVGKSFRAMRALQTGDICSQEQNAGLECLANSGTVNQVEACGGCYTTMGEEMIAMAMEMDENTSWNEACTLLDSEVCSKLKACVERECPSDCHDEMHATTACIVKDGMDGACDNDVCSPGYKAIVTFAAAVGCAAVGWMIL